MGTKHQHFSLKIDDGTYILGVSGGVDSVVLLDLLSQQANLGLIVAHFDHGIRADSSEDRKFVEELAKEHGLKFEYANGQLGEGASEDQARQARYKFLHAVEKKYEADGIITAHHQDDVIETAIINLIRGTNRKGLSSLRSEGNVLRPLIGTPRWAIEDYAKQRGLNWREDPSNSDTRYLRNYVRLIVIPKLSSQDSNWRQSFLDKINQSGRLNQRIDKALEQLNNEHLQMSEDTITIPRGWLIMLPNTVGLEVMRYAIERLPASVEINRQMLKRNLLFAKTAKPGKHKPLNNHIKMAVGERQIKIISEPTG